MIKNAEGLRLSAYVCPGGKWTIGYGHTRTAKKGMRIDQEQADNLLSRDIIVCEQCVNDKVTVKINQQIFDALVSFVFNFGCGQFTTSTLLKKLNAGNLVGAAEQFTRWVHVRNPVTKKMEVAPGLVARRAKERGLFEQGMLLSMGSPQPSGDAPQQDPRYPVRSATNAGLAVTTVGVLGAEASTMATQMAPLADKSELIQTVFVLLTLAGIALAAWGRFRVYKEKGV
jgi:lysozyme